MKRWAILTVFLYAVALMLLTVPVILVAFGNWGSSHTAISFQKALSCYTDWGYWIWLAILLAGQALLLLLPINLSERRLPARRPLKIPVIVTAFFLTNLFIAGIVSMALAIKLDGVFAVFKLFSLSPAYLPESNKDFASGEFWGAMLTLLCFWIIWGVIFRSFAKADAPEVLLQRLTRWLLRGSILELIIAVPSHVIVRRRDDCCAPAGTFWGIATGISVMLLCFGPGVYFLFVKRMRQLQPKKNSDAGKSNY